MPIPLAEGIFWTCAACCLVGEVAIARSIWTARSPRSTGAHSAPAGSLLTELGWTILPALLLGFVLWASWRALHPHS